MPILDDQQIEHDSEDDHAATLVAILERHGITGRMDESGSAPGFLMLQRDLWNWRRRGGAGQQPTVQLELSPGMSTGGRRPVTPTAFLALLQQQRPLTHSNRRPAGRFKLPPTLRHIEERLEDSRSMLDDDWDGEGSPGYAEDTWKRAAGLVVTAVKAVRPSNRTSIPTPAITPGPDGSIDILWESGSRKLLINLPDDPVNIATAYGRDVTQADEIIRAEFNPMAHGSWVLGWLMA